MPGRLSPGRSRFTTGGVIGRDDPAVFSDAVDPRKSRFTQGTDRMSDVPVV